LTATATATKRAPLRDARGRLDCGDARTIPRLTRRRPRMRMRVRMRMRMRGLSARFECECECKV
jgi:hypothetical protein